MNGYYLADESSELAESLISINEIIKIRCSFCYDCTCGVVYIIDEGNDYE